jgi:hypothetical protein
MRGTDRSSKSQLVYMQIIDAAKIVFQKAREKGAKNIVFFLSSDEWPLIKKGRQDILQFIEKSRETLSENEQTRDRVEIVSFPNISRAPSNIPLHLRPKSPHLRPFLHAINENQAEFYQRCIRTRPDQWKSVYHNNGTLSCFEVVQKNEIRPTYRLAADSVLEALLLAHSHFYISMSGLLSYIFSLP